MRFVLVGALFLALAGSASAAVFMFRTPSSNIGCIFTLEPSFGGPELRCDILSGLKPRPPKPRGCDLDWGFGYGLAPTGRARVVCAGDTAVDRRSKALRYGQRWSHGGFSCTSRIGGLRCTNRSGHGFFLSRLRSNRF
jgi:hypothetical protein